MNGRLLRAIGAIAATGVLLVGVPLLLILFVGNPWPGRARLELGDDVALVVGVLAVLAWLVWLRFAVALVIEVRQQVSDLRRAPPAGFAPPPPARRGVGFLAQRLVAAALIVIPIAPRVTTAVAQPAATTLVAAAQAAPPLSVGDVGSQVTVAAGDTLFGLARTHLGDAERWREIFELNRDRWQPDGGRLTSPSIIRAGWTLLLPVGAAMPEASPATYLAPETVTIETGDNLWSLSDDRLEQAGVAGDDAAVAEYLQTVVAANPDVVEDPDLIFAGEQFDFPAIGSPPLRLRLRLRLLRLRRRHHQPKPRRWWSSPSWPRQWRPRPRLRRRSRTRRPHHRLRRRPCPWRHPRAHHHRSGSARRRCCRQECWRCWRHDVGPACAPRDRVLASPSRPPRRSRPSAGCGRSMPESVWHASTSRCEPRPPRSSTRHRASQSSARRPTALSS